MVVITLQRAKCIGCNYCVEVAPAQFTMSKKDGKTVLLKSRERQGFYTLKSTDNQILDAALEAEKVCPVKIIKTKLV